LLRRPADNFARRTNAATKLISGSDIGILSDRNIKLLVEIITPTDDRPLAREEASVRSAGGYLCGLDGKFGVCVWPAAWNASVAESAGCIYFGRLLAAVATPVAENGGDEEKAYLPAKHLGPLSAITVGLVDRRSC
jgi:hypothetical protein